MTVRMLGRSAKLAPVENIERLILLVRGQKVILDADLAELYGVPTKVLVQTVKRNATAFRRISCSSSHRKSSHT